MIVVAAIGAALAAAMDAIAADQKRAGQIMAAIQSPGTLALVDELADAKAGFAAGMQLFPEVLATGIAVTLLVGLVAGIVPAIRSARRSIPDGLRQVG